MWRVVASVVLVLLAGCVQAPAPTPDEAGEPWIGPGIYRLSPSGHERLDEHPAVSWTTLDGRPGVHVDLLQLMQRDTMTAVIVEFLGAATGDPVLHSAIRYAAGVHGEGAPTGDYCSVGFLDGGMELEGRRTPAPELLAHLRTIALGGPAGTLAADPQMSGFQSAGDAANPLDVEWGVTIEQHGVAVGNGSSWLILSGTSGVPRLGIGADDAWYVDLPFDVPARVLLLPDSAFGCGMDFRRFRGAQAVAPPAHVTGGSWEQPGVYGASLGFTQVEVPGSLFPSNAARLTLGEQAWQADSATVLQEVGDQPVPVVLRNEQWTGSVLWLAAGMPYPNLDSIVRAHGAPACWTAEGGAGHMTFADGRVQGCVSRATASR